MVCKEDVLTWFKDAASYKRIDVMCSLLNMCIPFELRYLGTCIEEQGKHDYQELRGAALIANSLDKLAKELCGGKSLLEKCTRHRLTVYVSLLQSRNYTCAQWMYSVLLRSDAFDMFIASGAFNKDITLHTELLLLYTMVLNHPAFTFDQKRYFGEIVTRLSEYEMPTTTTMAATGALVPPPTHNPQPPPPCPPGLGYAIKAPLPVCVHHIPLTVGKPPNPLGHGEPPMPPPGIPLPTVHGEFVSPQGIWSRTHYISTTCPPPEMTAFPPPISPLVSQQSSPTPSRSVSPSRMYTCRPHPPPPPPPSTATIVTHMDRLPPPQVKDPLVMPTPQYNTDLKTVPIDEVSHGDVGDKTQQHQWLDAVVMAGKLPNGLIAGVPVATAKCPTMFISGDMQNLSLDGDMPLRCSSSSASSNSSDCHSPPDTPTGPGRGPHAGGGGGHLPLDGGGKICRTANVSGPPGLSAPLPTAADLAVTTFTNNCTVPYSTHYPPTTSFHPSRTMYYSQTYRPHQFPPAAYQQNGEIPYMFPPHYLPMLYSSAAAAAAAAAAPAPMPPAKLVNCYNCGMTGHTGAECKEPTIEEITQKKGYQLEYTTPPPEIQPQQQQGTIVDKQHQPHQQSQQQHQQSQQPNQQQQ